MQQENLENEIHNLAQKLVNLLKLKKMVISTAESCTGGMVASAITSISGASEVFNEGVITYSNEAKIRLLQVNSKTLGEFGAVSGQIAAQMAEGVLEASGAEISLATTGIAGPNGGSSKKPVGTVYLGIAGKFATQTVKLDLSHLKTREEIRLKTVEEALRNVLHQIEI